MSLSYFCPKCDSLLNPNVRVVLIARYREKQGIVLMSSQLGDYQVICDKGFCHGVGKGDAVNFCCPVCHASLTSDAHQNFTELKIVNDQKAGHEPFMLRFSRISEEHATFLYDGDTIKEFGEQAGVFRDELAIEGDWGW
jgi:hypothetical protein